MHKTAARSTATFQLARSCWPKISEEDYASITSWALARISKVVWSDQLPFVDRQPFRRLQFASEPGLLHNGR
jgi:hypothetical protein